MTIGFIILAHDSLHRVADVAVAIASKGKPIAIHVDSKTESGSFSRLQTRLAEYDNVLFVDRQPCEWGSWSIVSATISAAEHLLQSSPDLTHFYLMSGSCLPLRPVDELEYYLEQNPKVDFIESVTTDEVDWTIGGLNEERFTFRFPFSWKRQRWLFDKYVALQKQFGIRRRVPKGITPHMGSQWWCLTRETLSAILNDPRRSEFETYFEKVWIPDESYFQTLARLHSSSIQSRSLTLTKFDFQGKPHVFYDDHFQLLKRSNCFVARKIWPSAEKLFDGFLNAPPKPLSKVEPDPSKVDRHFTQTMERRTRGRPGLYMHGRFPDWKAEHGITAGRYSVFQGFADLFEDFEEWLTKRTGCTVHGHLFAPERVEFHGRSEVFNGGMSDSSALRDHNPEAFLTNLIWNTRGEQQCFQFGPTDAQAISGLMARDRNAHIFVISGAWAIPFFRSGADFQTLRAKAARLQKIESRQINDLRKSWTKAQVRIWTLSEFIEAPMENLQTILDEIGGAADRRVTEAPRMAELAGFGQFLQELRNQGMTPYLMGDFSAADSNDGISDAPNIGRQ